MGIHAKVILDSINPQGNRLTTFEVTLHRFEWPSVMTYKRFSRNSGSSRAIPTAKVRKKVREEPAYPVHWGANQKGMTANDELPEDKILLCKSLWDQALGYMCGVHEELERIGLHKQVANRLLEPFMYHTAIVTATEWDNFFWQRLAHDAQPEIRVLAEKVWEAYNNSTPKLLNFGEWHTPYILEDEYVTMDKETRKQVSSGRCGRVSYLTHDGIRDFLEDIGLYKRLTDDSAMHWSPLEHVARPMEKECERKLCVNYEGWVQLRKIVEKDRGKYNPYMYEFTGLKGDSKPITATNVVNYIQQENDWKNLK